MKVQMRRVSTKRHTLGFKISGKWYTRRQAWDLARSGKVDGVSARKIGRVRYIQSHKMEKRLYDLPTVIES